jgi:hypothetical protein
MHKQQGIAKKQIYFIDQHLIFDFVEKLHLMHSLVVEKKG